MLLSAHVRRGGGARLNRAMALLLRPTDAFLQACRSVAHQILGGASPAPSSPNHWECVGCEACIPLDTPVCPKCGELPPWQCGPCHSHNKEETRACVNCNSPRGTLEVGIAHSNPILRGHEPLSTLAGDSGSVVIKAKVMSLSDSHPFWCKVRGDGNCFYREPL